MKGKSMTKRAQAKEKLQVNWLRNLRREELGAVIFGCKNHTITECLEDKIFGLPAAHFSYVKNISPGLKLFLFNYSDRKLHGIFKATTHGKMNLDSRAWITNEGTETTPYPAQVGIDVQRECRPLCEQEFKPLIADNYYEDRLFWFELDKDQARALTSLFLSTPQPRNATKLLDYTFDALPRSKKKRATDKLSSEEFSGLTDVNPQENHEHPYASALVASNTYTPEKKWNQLFKVCASSSEVKNVEDGESQEEKMSLSESDSTNFAFEFAKLQSISKPIPEASRTVNTDVVHYVEETHKNESNERDIDASLKDSTFDSLVMELIQENEGLKASNVEQGIKIESLQHDLNSGIHTITGSQKEVEKLQNEVEKTNKIMKKLLQGYNKTKESTQRTKDDIEKIKASIMFLKCLLCVTLVCFILFYLLQ